MMMIEEVSRIAGPHRPPTPRPVMTHGELYLRAIASYTDPQGKDTSSETSAAEVTLRTDNAPKFLETESGRRSIEENSADGTNATDDGDREHVGDPVRATDTDALNTQLLTYRLSGADAGSFTITSDIPTMRKPSEAVR